ncbi:MAG: 50S ribosomal protein L24 [Sphaerochaetaceae bacterium]|jgi:large subunit ribosomal protein L24|nr:50S ribosomal protein L24 [Sphaerochaetaceae bacterium]
MKLKKNDTVMVMTGKDKGLVGKIVKVNPNTNRAIVQGANLVKKTVKKRSQQDQGGIIDIEAPIAISNLSLVVDGKISKIGYKFDENGKKVRFAKKTGEVL